MFSLILLTPNARMSRPRTQERDYPAILRVCLDPLVPPCSVIRAFRLAARSLRFPQARSFAGRDWTAMMCLWSSSKLRDAHGLKPYRDTEIRVTTNTTIAAGRHPGTNLSVCALAHAKRRPCAARRNADFRRPGHRPEPETKKRYSGSPGKIC